jgi:hypothetical protein
MNVLSKKKMSLKKRPEEGEGKRRYGASGAEQKVAHDQRWLVMIANGNGVI